MTDKELIASLKRLKVQTGSLACLGCGRHQCQRRGALCGLRGHGGGGPAGGGGTDLNEKKPSPFRGWAMVSADIGIAALAG